MYLHACVRTSKYGLTADLFAKDRAFFQLLTTATQRFQSLRVFRPPSAFFKKFVFAACSVVFFFVSSVVCAAFVVDWFLVGCCSHLTRLRAGGKGLVPDLLLCLFTRQFAVAPPSPRFVVKQIF